MQVRIGRLGWKSGVTDNVFYDAAGREWRRIFGPLWWLLVGLLLIACEPSVRHVNVPCDAIHPIDRLCL